MQLKFFSKKREELLEVVMDLQSPAQRVLKSGVQIVSRVEPHPYEVTFQSSFISLSTEGLPLTHACTRAHTYMY